MQIQWLQENMFAYIGLAELLNHLETLMSILCLTMEEIKLILLTACEEIKMKKTRRGGSRGIESVLSPPSDAP